MQVDFCASCIYVILISKKWSKNGQKYGSSDKCVGHLQKTE